MNLGKTILELRKQKNVTQEELAAELGVTAAAVSKWENGYTLPDILMLCALADFFAVTTDELLGRAKELKYAVIAAKTPELGGRIKKLALDYGISVRAICATYAEAMACAQQDDTVKYLLVSLNRPITEEETRDAPSGLVNINVECDTEQETLDGFEMYFQHMDTFYALVEQKAQAAKHS